MSSKTMTDEQYMSLILSWLFTNFYSLFCL